MAFPSRVTAYLFLFTVARTAALQLSQYHPSTQQHQRILLFGDSLTAGQCSKTSNEKEEYRPPGDRLRELLVSPGEESDNILRGSNLNSFMRGESVSVDPVVDVQVAGKCLESVSTMPARLRKVLLRSNPGVGSSSSSSLSSFLPSLVPNPFFSVPSGVGNNDGMRDVGTATQASEDRSSPPFDTIILMGGSNDLWKLKPGYIIRHLEECVRSAEEYNPSVRVGCVTLPPFDPAVVGWFGQDYRRRLERCRLETNASIIDFVRRSTDNHFLVDVAALCDERPELSRPDGMHFEAMGYEAIGETIFRTLPGLQAQSA